MLLFILENTESRSVDFDQYYIPEIMIWPGQVLFLSVAFLFSRVFVILFFIFTFFLKKLLKNT